MNLLGNCTFVLLMFVFWSFAGFAQSGKSEKEKPKAPEVGKSVKEQKVKKEDENKAGENKADDKKTEKGVGENKSDGSNKAGEKKAESKVNGNDKAGKKSDKKKTEKKTDDKKAGESKTGDKKMGSSNQSTSTSTSSKEDNIETLEVTGSYIRRSDIEGPSPVLVIDKEQIERSGFNSISDFLERHTTVLPFGDNGLRGLGSTRTLILINGQRAPGHGSLYGSMGGVFGPGEVSLDIIPLAAVDRVEVLTDGASAIYGSDALGGVINVITRKDFDGMSVVAKTDITDYKGSDVLRTSLAYGKTFNKGHFLTSLQYMHRTDLRYSNIKRLENFYDSAVRSPNYHQNYEEKNSRVKPYPGAKCDRIDSGNRCENHVTDQFGYPAAHGIDWVTDTEYEVFNDVKLYSTLYLGYGISPHERPPTFFRTPVVDGRPAFGGIDLENPPGNITSVIGGGPVRMYGQIDEMPNRKFIDKNIASGLILGLKGDLGITDWVWDITTNNQFDYTQSTYENLGIYKKVKQALTDGTYNPFGSPRETQGFSYNGNTSNRSQVNWFEAKTRGSLGSLFNFDLASAFGVSFAHFEYSERGDPRAVNQELMTLTGVVADGQRQLYAAFAELSALYENIEIQLALRGDMYSDFGSTINPKLAARYQPFNMIGFRTSFGTGFQAPLLQDTYGPKLIAFSWLVDQKRCNEGKECQLDLYSTRTGGNLNLKEETSMNFNFGVVFDPIKNLNFSVDYWNVVVEDTIDSDIRGILRIEAIDPSAPERYGSKVNRNRGTGVIESVEAFKQNLGKEEAHGLDFNGSFKMVDPFFKGSLSLGLLATYMFHYYTSFYEELGREQVLGQYGKPRWRSVSNISYGLGPFSGSLTARSFAKVETYARGQGHIPSHTQFDLSFGWDPSWGGIFQLGAINAFNNPPEYDYTHPFFVNNDLYNGERTWFFSYRQDF